MNNRLIVLHIVRNPQIGGAEMLVKNILNANKDQDVEHFLVYSNNGPLLDLIAGSKRLNTLICRYNKPISFIYNLRQVIKRSKAKIIHCHQPADVIYSYFASLGLKACIVRTYHGYEGVNRRVPGFSFRRRIMYFFINRFVSLNLFVSNDLMKYYRLINPNQRTKSQKVLYNGVNESDYLMENATGIRVDEGIPKDSIILGMIGGFNTMGRDHITICKALKLVLETNPGVHFLFIGKTGGRLNYLYDNCLNYCIQNGLNKNVHFLGERSDAGSILKELDLYVHSSNHETFGIALVEAMLSGLPSIASDIPPFREVSDNGKHLILYEKGNVKDLHKRIIIELNNLDSIETKERIRYARIFAESNFSIQVHLKKLHNMYYECQR